MKKSRLGLDGAWHNLRCPLALLNRKLCDDIEKGKKFHDQGIQVGLADRNHVSDGGSGGDST
jgi:hypothetical protein